MNSRVSWSVEGIDPSVRERAEAAARRAGMSLSDWLNSTIGDPAPPNFRARPDHAADRSADRLPDQRPAMPAQETQDVADIHQRLDSITRQIERISRPLPPVDAPRGDMLRNDAPRSDAARHDPGVARQLNDAISRLDARLSQISSAAPARQPQHDDRQRQAEMVERAAAQVYTAQAYRPSPPLSPASFDSAIAEISARQHELDGPPPRPVPPRYAPPTAPSMPAAPAMPITPSMPAGPDFSSLERHLVKITSQIEALQRPDHIEQSVKAFRSELAEIRNVITEAMPRRAIESIENEIRSLSRRIDDTRQSGTDGQALAGIERALSEIRQALRSLTPAEQLAGYDEAIRNLGAKLDMILRASDDPSTIHQLEGAITALRSIVSNVASNDALARLSEDVRMLSSKVDLMTRSDGQSDTFAVLEQRIAALTSSLESREQRAAPAHNTEQLESALRTLSDRIDRLPVGNDNASAFAHLEQRVSYLLERLEASSENRGGNLGRVEDGLQDILRHLETQHASFAALSENSRGGAAAPADSGIVDLVKRELSDIRFSQSEAGRHTQDSLEAVHNTLGHVVDRLAMIEGDLRAVRSQPVAPQPEPPLAPAYAPPQPAAATRVAMAPQPKPELPNPVAAPEQFAAAPREFHAASAPAPQIAAAAAAPKAISEILVPTQPRVAIEPDLPPDHPLEPGTRPSARVASPTERIAASESAISGIPASPSAPVSTSSFIAAARRAAQAAAAAQPDAKGGRGSAKQPANGQAKEASTITSKIRSLLVGASVVVIVLGTFKMAMNLLDSSSALQPATESASEPPPAVQPPVGDAPKPAPAMPSMTSPTPIGRQSLNNNAAPDAPDGIASVAIPQTNSDVTGTLPSRPIAPSNSKLTLVAIPAAERLPDAIGGPVLRTAALKGDPTAAYEIGVRYAEGKGVTANYDEAAKWYDRAAQAGVVPAVFRLGTLYEKGLSVKKDIDTARRYYMQAAERGNAKAMHNLAVLDADGDGKGANYKNAAQWFRKAADRGVADSQFNLGILYARGIGVEQNLAESFKWFSLAAAQGDADSGRKRDDIAKRLDAQSLAAAKLAIQTFTPEPQPDDAINVATPAGGWDSAPAQAQNGAAKPAAKPAAPKRTAAAH
ncbi:tetratricopeptide repeat protein [Bradyrhizobium sp. dw_411]|uniref:tetratricopeptide repeat protein n=1 Tax=Bradyrhizobium sp. dw_411 TaxID=2720082 RepID=UPI001BCE4AC1|nr:tetratricopeptide repeat protein [Bradyrhizobium sp. dw_411]